MQDSDEILNTSIETRTPRDKFTKKLSRICEKLDARSQGLVPWKNDYAGKTGSVDTIIEELWVFGSYARGSQMCGDLDIIVKINNKALTYLIGRHVSKFFFGAPRDVNVYVGTPDENQSGLQIEDAILIWSGKKHDWRASIAALKPDPTAGRYVRNTDVFPIRPEQINLPFRHASLMLRAHADEIIKWSFTPFDLNSSTNSASEQLVIDRYWKKCRPSKRSSKLLPHIFRSFNHLAIDFNASINTTQTKPIFGDIAILLGNQVSLSPSLLEQSNIQKIAVVPHLTARGPNGIWWIERGKKHPLQSG